MKTLEYDVAVIGGGPAGLAAALEAKEGGAGRVVIIERDRELGGILQQCIHPGFGLHLFKEELTGPEYAGRFIGDLSGIDVLLNTMVLELAPDRTVYAVSSSHGVMAINAKAVVLAMGCRERTRGAIAIPGSRPAGIFTAGTAQRFVNVEGYMPGRKVVILGSGDIGLIMARRLTLEGAEVKAVLEVMPYPGGLARNIAQCLDDFGIPLLLSHTVTRVHGKERVEGVTCAEVDEQRRPIPGTEKFVECDTLLLSVGLIPENEVSRGAGVEIDEVTGGPVVTELMETSVPGVFACGNAVHVHDLVDNVTREARVAGRAAAAFATSRAPGAVPAAGSETERIRVFAGQGIRYVVPHKLSLAAPDGIGRTRVPLLMRVTRPERNAYVEVTLRGEGEGDATVLLKRGYPSVRPGEMLEIPLDLQKVVEATAGLSAALGAGLRVEVRLAAEAAEGEVQTSGRNAGGGAPAGPAAGPDDVLRTITCVVCPAGCEIAIRRRPGTGTVVAAAAASSEEAFSSESPNAFIIEGFGCKRGKVYAQEELTSPRRTLTTTVRVTGGSLPLVPVRTRGSIPKRLVMACMGELNRVELAAPVRAGQVVVKDILGTGVDVVATRDVEERKQGGLICRAGSKTS